MVNLAVIAMDLIPAIDLLQGRAVRLLRGSYASVTEYHADPVGLGAAWTDAGVGIVHVVDLDAARGRGPSVDDTVIGLAERGVRCQVGGGVRTPERAVALIEAGAERVVVGSAFVDTDGPGEAIAESVGGDRVVAAIDVRDGLAVGHGWISGGVPFGDVVARTLAAGVERMLVTGIDVDGTMEGPDIALLESVAATDPTIKVIASGGVGSLRHIRRLREGPSEAVIVGRALYEGRFGIREALAAASG